MLVYILYLIYLFCVDAKPWYSLLAYHIDLRDKYWTPASILVLYMLALFLVRASLPIFLIVELAFAAPFVLLDIVYHTADSAEALHDPLDCDHGGLHVSSLSASIVAFTTLCNTLLFGPTVFGGLMQAFGALYRTLGVITSWSVMMSRSGIVFGKMLVAMFSPVAYASTRLLLGLTTWITLVLFPLLHKISIAGLRTIKASGVASLLVLRRLRSSSLDQLYSLASPSKALFEVVLNTVSPIFTFLKSMTSIFFSYCFTTLSLSLGHLAILVSTGSHYTREVIAFARSNLSTIHYLIVIRILLWATSTSPRISNRRHMRITGFVFDAAIIVGKIYMSFGDHMVLVIGRFAALLSSAVYLVTGICISSVAHGGIFFSNLLVHCISAVFGAKGLLGGALLPWVSHYAFIHAASILSGLVVEMASFASDHLSKKLYPHLISSGVLEKASKSPVQLEALGKKVSTHNAVVDQRQQPNTQSFATVLRRPVIYKRRHSPLMNNSTGDIGNCKTYLKAGYCAAAIASRFMECGSYIRAMLSASSCTEDARTLTLEDKLSELVSLEDQTRGHIEAGLDEKLGDLRRFLPGDTFEVDPDVCDDSVVGNISDNINDFQLAYSWTLLQRLFDTRIRLARIDVELGNTALQLAAEKVRYASDCTVDGRMFKPVCDTDIDLYDFMALGDVHEEDVIIRNFVAQKSEFQQSFDSFLNSPKRDWYSEACKLTPSLRGLSPNTHAGRERIRPPTSTRSTSASNFSSSSDPLSGICASHDVDIERLVVNSGQTFHN